MTPGPAGNRRWHVGCQDRARYRRVAERYRSAGEGGLHSEEELFEHSRSGLPSWSDKLVGEVMHLLLEATFYEPQSRPGHGSRPGRGCHTACAKWRTVGRGRPRSLEGDISGHCSGASIIQCCFDTTRKSTITGPPAAQTHAASRSVDMVWKATLSSAPRGVVTCPLQYLPGPAGHVRRDSSHTRYTRRAPGLVPIPQVTDRIGSAERVTAPVRELRDSSASLPSRIFTIPAAASSATAATPTITSWSPTQAEAEQIKTRLAHSSMTTSSSNLNQEKTLITHARTGAASFLGYDITVQHSRDRRTSTAISVCVSPGGDQGQVRPVLSTENPSAAPSC